MTTPAPPPHAPRDTRLGEVGPAPCWQRLVHTDDLDQHAHAQPGWALHYEQLSPGRFSGLVHHVQLPGTRLVHERCDLAVRQRGSLGADHYGFAMPLHAGTQPAIFNGQRVDADAIMLGSGAELDLCTPERFSLVAVVVQADLLNPLWQQMYGRPPSAWIESQLVVGARAGLAAELRACHLRVMQDAAALLGPAVDGGAVPADDTAARQLRDALLIEWFEALPDSIDASGLPGALARKRLVDRACELMLAQADEPLSMLDVCRRLGTSRRKLNYCFHDVLGSSPVKHLRAVRLNGVRRELRNTAPSVQDAAARWGFWHLGQFSRDYKRQFGELPSVTLKRR